MKKLVSTQWLSENLGEPDLVVLDCSVKTDTDENDLPVNSSGYAVYQQEHLPGAGFADLKGDLCDQESDIEFALPSPEQFCAAMGELGVGDNSRVVLYDNSLSAWAARVWWMLRWVGFENAAILDGGLRVWKAEGRPLESGPVERPAVKLNPRPRPALVADREEVMAAIDDGGVCLIDTLPEPFFAGEASLYGRGGHIPTAVNYSGVGLVDESGRYKSLDVLAEMHRDLDKSKRQITYCGGGILASSNAFVMTLLGFENVAVYTASMQEWAKDPQNPLTMT